MDRMDFLGISKLLIKCCIMTNLIYGFYNLDTNSMEQTNNDGSSIAIDC